MNIVVFTGFAGTGKSTLSGMLSSSYGLEFIEHQKMLHEMAVVKGYERARHWLFDVGNEEFIRESEDEMVRRIGQIKEEGRSGIVVDVSYGEQMLQRFREAFPEANLLIISVVSGLQVRGERIMGRMSARTLEEAQREREFRDDFLERAGVRGVMERADVTVANNGSIKETFQQLLRELDAKGVSFP